MSEKFPVVKAEDISKTGRFVDMIFVHCSASSNPDDDDASVIDRWHRANGWAGIGYHFFIKRNGDIQIGRSIDKAPAAQGGLKNQVKELKGRNAGTIAVCLHGGGGDPPRDDFSPAQRDSLKRIAQVLHSQYPNATFHGHCEVAHKACPVLNYKLILNLDENGHIGLGGYRPNRADIPPMVHKNIRTQAEQPAPVAKPTLLGWLKRLFGWD